MTTSPFAEHSARLTRELIHSLVTESDDERLAERVGSIARELTRAAGQPGAVTVEDPHTSTSRIEGDRTPGSSARNPIAPPMSIHSDGIESRCEVTLPLQYQGPPGRVHGGIVALLLDHVLGNAANVGEGPRSFTRYLNVSYEAATLIGEPLTVVGRVGREDGRKLFMQGEVLCRGEVSARGEGLWLSPRDEWAAYRAKVAKGVDTRQR